MQIRSHVTASCAVSGLILALAGPAGAQAEESLDQALCRLIETSAARHGIPADFFTRLIWKESSFRAGVTSPAGAQGIAQFMPGTATERRLADPFDPEQAIPAAAHLLADLNRRFGNLGLAAAAYNAGPARVSAWMGDRGGLPAETQAYVLSITGHPAEAWADAAQGDRDTPAASEDKNAQSCLQLAALLRRPGGAGSPGIALSPMAPWGVQLAGHFSKAVALAAYERARRGLGSVLGDARPMVIGTRLRSRGTRTFYRVRMPAPSREAASSLCDRIRSAGGACVVLPSSPVLSRGRNAG